MNAVGLILLYLAGYLSYPQNHPAIATVAPKTYRRLVGRDYHQEWMPSFYAPAAWLDSQLSGRILLLDCPDSWRDPVAIQPWGTYCRNYDSRIAKRSVHGLRQATRFRNSVRANARAGE